MSADEPVHLSHFSDLLCVWAYVSQVRVDELKKRFGDQIRLSYHFIPVFGSTPHRIGEGWKGRGEFAGYSEHVRQVCRDFPHVEISDRVWIDHPPHSSGASHHFLKAVQVLESEGIISADPQPNLDDKTFLEALAWRARLAFFRDNRDISRIDTLLELARDLNLPVDRIEERLNSGEAMAALWHDVEIKDRFRVEGSPTYVLNEGRQKLYGNLGYRILEANVQEILQRPEGQASWC